MSRPHGLSPLFLSIQLLLFVSFPQFSAGCEGDQYWPEPRGFKTWITREIITFKAPDTAVSDQLLRQALLNANLFPCNDFEKDLIGQDLQVKKALRSNVFFTRWTPDGWINIRDFGQVMVRLLSRTGSEGTIEVLIRTKRQQQGTSIFRSQSSVDAPIAIGLAQRVAHTIQKPLGGASSQNERR